MNQLITLILTLFESFTKTISVKSNGMEYSPKYIINAAKNLAESLNDSSARKLNIALVANNSVEWIIVFLAVILSKHRLVLFSPNLSLSKLYHVLLDAKCNVLITDIDNLDIRKLSMMMALVYKIDDLSLNGERSINLPVNSEQDEITNGVIIYTPRRLDKIFISYNQILSHIRKLEEKKIFSTSTEYILFQELTYNYILCLFLPLLQGVTIVIPNKSRTPYSIYNSLMSNKTEIVVLTAYQFECLWREYIENSCSTVTELIKEFRLRRLRRWRVNRRLKKLFPKLEELIILNSSISTKMEYLLKDIKFPYTVTYGTVETMGIISYSNHKQFELGSVGHIIDPSLKIHNESICYLLETGIEDQYFNVDLGDIGYIEKDKPVLYFQHRKSDEIVTEYGFTIAGTIERIVKDLPHTVDCMLIMHNNELVLIVNIDEDYADYKHMSMRDIKLVLEECRKEINEKVHTFEKISIIKIDPTKFKRDSYDRVLKEVSTL